MPSQPSLLADDDDPLRLALPAPAGCWDELRAAEGGLAPLWRQFWTASGAPAAAELDARAARLARRVLEDGASYNVYAAEGSASQVWPLELLPLLVDAQEWARIAAGLQQRARLLEAVLADVYAADGGKLLREGLLPPQLVLAHPQYLRAMRGCTPPGGQHLHLIGFDLARAADGHWWLVAQRTQAPSGLGYLLQNRLLVSEQFPEAFRALAVQRLGGGFRSLLQGLLRLAQRHCCAPGEAPRLALLTAGASNETYFEQVFLARYLGLALVEAGDLVVRGERLYQKTLQGLERVHGLLRRVDDEYLDPLELRADSQLGVPGLVQALRAGQLVVANAPGAGWLESPGLAAFWPGVAEALLGEELLLPASSGWWCGEASAWARSREQLAEQVVVPTFPASQTTRDFAPFLAAELDEAAQVQLAARIDAEPAAHTLKQRVHPSQQPVWAAGRLEPRAAILRVYALADGAGGWTLLPGGLTRVARERGGGSSDALLTMQAGCASVDTWVLAENAQAVDPTSLLPPPLRAEELARAQRPVSSRAAENLFWLGRYSERAENSLRLARQGWTLLQAADGRADARLQLLDHLARRHGLVSRETPEAMAEPAGFAQRLLQELGDEEASSVAFNLRQLARCGEALRERLSPAHAQLLNRLPAAFAQRIRAAQRDGGAELASALAASDEELAAVSGAQLDRMTRDDGWRMLSCGRQIERLHYLSELLREGLQLGLDEDDAGFSLLLALFDSTITYRARFPGRRERAPLLQLLVMDDDNPRALAWVARTLRGRLLKLARHDPDWARAAVSGLPDPDRWRLGELAAPDGQALDALLRNCGEQVLALSQEIGRRLFAHVEAPARRVWS